MAETTQIEWADATLNTAWGCTKVSSGCDNCYMFRLSRMYGKVADRFMPRELDAIKRSVKKLGSPKVVFLNSMSDTFHEDASFDLIDSWLELLRNTNHTYIMLTKRVKRMSDYFKTRTVPDNFWVGTSIENKGAYHRLNTLKKINARVKFVSLEPMLEAMPDIDLDGIQWCVVGGESDYTDPRPFDPQWALQIRDQCAIHDTKFFYKQSGGKTKTDGVWGTNILDGKKYLEMPVLLKTKQSTLGDNTKQSTLEVFAK